MSSDSLKIAYGSFELPLKISGLETSCFILNDGQCVLPISGIQKLLGYEGKSEIWLLNILNTISKFAKIPELIEAYEIPIKITVKHKLPIQSIELVSSNVFIETCKTLIEAKNEGLLGVNLIKISKIAELLLKHLGNQKIDDVIALATGFSIFKAHAKLSLQKYMQRQLEDNTPLWLNTFPDDLFTAIFKINDQDWKSMNANPEIMGKLFHEIIFSRIPPKLSVELKTNPPKRAYKRKNNQAQNNEHPELKKHIAYVMQLLETSGSNRFIFLQLLNRTMPVNNEYSSKLRFETSSSKKESLSSFNSSLKKLT